jgi:hypothetical protein
VRSGEAGNGNVGMREVGRHERQMHCELTSLIYFTMHFSFTKLLRLISLPHPCNIEFQGIEKQSRTEHPPSRRDRRV